MVVVTIETTVLLQSEREGGEKNTREREREEGGQTNEEKNKRMKERTFGRSINMEM